MILLQIPSVLVLSSISVAQGVTLVTVWIAIAWVIYFAASFAAGPEKAGGSRIYFVVLRVLMIVACAFWFLGALTNSESLLGPALSFSIGCLAAAYFIPTAIAAARRHPNLAAVFAVNFFLGWTFLGFVACVIWALHRSDASPPVPAAGIEESLRTLKKLRSDGLISEQEFEEKRSAVLSSLAST
ncbi:MAG: hypothetical protein QOJ64_2141 [Acidobacteriota bacterium]|jgi:hypothetical protein|nr:hypothetical protein [Acidobacteriota bacterium]